VQVAGAENLILDVGAGLLRLVRAEVEHLGAACAERHAVGAGAEADGFAAGGDGP